MLATTAPHSSRTRWRAGAAALVTGALAGGVLIAPPAQAVMQYGEVYAGGNVYGYVIPNTNSTQCTKSALTSTPGKAMSDNGATVSTAHSRSATLTHPSKPTDISDVTMSGSGTARTTPITAAGGSMRFSGRAAVSAKHRLATSACSVSVSAYGSADGMVEIPVGMWVSVTANAQKSGSGGVRVEIYPDDTDDGLDLTVGAGRSTGSASGYLAAGRYSVRAEARADAYISATGTKKSSVSGSATITFTPGGAASAVTGKGASYVSLGGRSCTTNAVSAAVTKKARSKAKKVVIKANGVTRVTLKGRKLKRAGALTLAGLAPTSNVSVVATITPKRGKKVTVSRSYRACR